MTPTPENILFFRTILVRIGPTCKKSMIYHVCKRLQGKRSQKGEYDGTRYHRPWRTHSPMLLYDPFQKLLQQCCQPPRHSGLVGDKTGN